MDDSSTNSPELEEMHTELPTLHVRLTPQGSTNVTVHLTAHQQAGPPHQTPSGLSDSARQQYQEQLRKAQETLLPQNTDLQVQQCMMQYASRNIVSGSASCSILHLQASFGLVCMQPTVPLCAAAAVSITATILLVCIKQSASQVTGTCVACQKAG